MEGANTAELTSTKLPRGETRLPVLPKRRLLRYRS